MQENPSPKVAIIGAGPAGLMAAQVIASAGMSVHVFDAMPSAGRKFLLAGRSGMNISHAEEFAHFSQRFFERSETLLPYLQKFDCDAIRAWALDLGIETFVGSSGRVFPVGMKAAPLLRAWLQRLHALGVEFSMRHRCVGKNPDGSWRFLNNDVEKALHFDHVVLACGGMSWARLGSDGAWVSWLSELGIAVAPLRPSNCGFLVSWSDHFCQRYAGNPLTHVAIRVIDQQGNTHEKLGQFVVTERGVEGSLIYAFSSILREQIIQNGQANLELDLLPAWTREKLSARLNQSRASRSLTSFLKSSLGLHPVQIGLLYERLTKEEMYDGATLAQRIKALPLTLDATTEIDKAISCAGGVPFEELNPDLSLKAHPNVFCAGEMLDWEAPTGGYLLSACMATGAAAGRGVLKKLKLS